MSNGNGRSEPTLLVGGGGSYYQATLDGGYTVRCYAPDQSLAAKAVVTLYTVPDRWTLDLLDHHSVSVVETWTFDGNGEVVV